MNPNASLHDPRPEYIRSLIERAGLTQKQAAESVGVSERMMRYYLANQDDPNWRPIPYPAQYLLERLPKSA